MLRAVLTGLALLCAVRPAAAEPDDLVLSRLATRLTDNTGAVVSAVGQNLEFRALASQLGTVLAPHLVGPADTIGFAGFEFDLDGSQTTIDSFQSYWRVLAGSPDPSGLNRVAHGLGVMRTIGFFAHKGLSLPPSVEIGAGAVHVIDSSMWAVQAYGKIALHEGYHDSAIPSVAVGGAISQLMNQRDIELTVAALDLTISKHFGIAGSWRLDPFIGADLLIIIPRSEVQDATANLDPLQPGQDKAANNNFVFRDQSAIYRERILAGAKLQYDIYQLTLESQLALAGHSADDRAAGAPPCQANSMTADCQAKDTATSQITVSLSAGFSF